MTTLSTVVVFIVSCAFFYGIPLLVVFFILRWLSNRTARLVVFYLRQEEGLSNRQKTFETTPDHWNEPVAVTVRSDKLIVALKDGRQISTPLIWFEWLYVLPPERKERFELKPTSIYWPDAKKTLDVEGLIMGKYRPVLQPHERET